MEILTGAVKMSEIFPSAVRPWLPEIFPSAVRSGSSTLTAAHDCRRTNLLERVIVLVRRDELEDVIFVLLLEGSVLLSVCEGRY